MKERPILFSAPMVRAILEDRKTQTRRIVKQHWDWWDKTCGECGGTGETYIGSGEFSGNCKTCANEPLCPYGKVGDRLWVRETFAPSADQWGAYAKWLDKFCNVKGDKPDIFYAADGGERPFIERWRPSIHMPRWASRIDLEITNVRVERLNDINEQDAIAEGIQKNEYSAYDVWLEKEQMYSDATGCPIEAFKYLWESINGDGSWDANPWCWVIEFKGVQP